MVGGLLGVGLMLTLPVDSAEGFDDILLLQHGYIFAENDQDVKTLDPAADPDRTRKADPAADRAEQGAEKVE